MGVTGGGDLFGVQFGGLGLGEPAKSSAANPFSSLGSKGFPSTSQVGTNWGDNIARRYLSYYDSSY